MKDPGVKFIVIANPIAFVLIALLSGSAAQATDENLNKGIDEYRHKQYEDAAGDLGAALPSEFNNPYLHYYMGNCMVHMRHKDAAIREYRIAYALQPDGRIGHYCRLCLDRFGIDADGRKLPPKLVKEEDDKKAPPVPEPPSAAELAALRANPKDGSATSLEREKSVSNLKDLLQQKRHPSGAPTLRAEGTNLYVRSYQSDSVKAQETGAPKLKGDAGPATAPRVSSTSRDAQAINKSKSSLWWW